ncbi:hypothetical protein LEMLEM_LOCUS10098 [Lemmus lemmus]
MRVTEARTTRFFRVSGFEKPSLRCVARKSLRDQTKKASGGAPERAERGSRERQRRRGQLPGADKESAPPEVTCGRPQRRKDGFAVQVLSKERPGTNKCLPCGRSGKETSDAARSLRPRCGRHEAVAVQAAGRQQHRSLVRANTRGPQPCEADPVISSDTRGSPPSRMVLKESSG